MARLTRLSLVFAALLAASASAYADVISIFGSIGSALGAGAATTAGAITVGSMVVSTAISLVGKAYASGQAKRRARQAAARKFAEDVANLRDRTATVLQTDSPWQVVYGSPARVGGSIVSMMNTGLGAEWKHLIVIFASHECEGIDEIYIDGAPIGMPAGGGWATRPDFFLKPEYAGDMSAGPAVKVSVHLSPGGVDTADADLMGAVNAPIGGVPIPNFYTAAHRLSGYTYCVVSLNQFMDRFQGGVPEITARIRGKKVYDPRTGLNAYSRNPALCLADFLRSEAGYLAAQDQIDEAALIAAANACDEAVYGGDAMNDLPNYGGSMARYVCDGVFRSDQDRESTRQQIEESMAGFSLESAGVWRIQAGVWSTPVMALTDNDMLAPLTLVQAVNKGETRFNTARGSYINAAGNGATEEFAKYVNPTFLAADGRPKVRDLALPFTGSFARCHQLARVAIEQSRGGAIYEIHPKMSAWHLQPGDRITLTSALYGLSGHTFRVQDWTYSRNAPLSLLVIEDIPDYYDLADETRADPTPPTNLPSPFTAPLPPMDLSVGSGPDNVVQQDGTLIVRVVARWARATDPRVLLGGAVRVQWRLKASDQAWQSTDLPGDSSEAEIFGLRVGSVYQVRVSFMTAYASSSWVLREHLVVGRTAPPGAVVGLQLQVQSDGVHARWSAPEDMDLLTWSTTSLRIGTDWATAAEVFSGRTTAANLGWLQAGLVQAWAAHSDTSNRWSAPVSVAIEILPPAQPVVSGDAWRDQVELQWPVCQTTQPLRGYEVRVGDIFADAQVLTLADALGHKYTQAVPGTYVYWVTAIDAAGNRGASGYKQLTTLPGVDEAIDELQEGVQAAIADLLNINSGLVDKILIEAQQRGTSIAHLQNLVTEGDEQLAQEIALVAARSVGYVRGNLLYNGGFEFGLDGWTGQNADWVVADGVYGRTAEKALPEVDGSIVGKAFAAAPDLWYAMAADTRHAGSEGQCRLGIEFLGAGGARVGIERGPSLGQHEFLTDRERRVARAFEVQAPPGTATARAFFEWTGNTARRLVGVRQVKVEQGRLPITPYTAEASAIGAVAAVQTETAARVSAVAAEAAARQTLAVRVGSSEAALTEEKAARIEEDGKLQARYGIRLTVGGKASGFITNNDGKQSDFVVLADKFAWATEGPNGQVKLPVTFGNVNGTSSFGFDGNMFLDGALKARMIDAEQIQGTHIRANELEARHLKAGAVTADKISVGVGANLLVNSNFVSRAGKNNAIPTGWACWSDLPDEAFMPIPVNAGSFADRAPMNSEGLALRQVSNSAAGSITAYCDFPCEPGKRYEATAYTGAHRCTVRIELLFYDASNNRVGGGGSGAVSVNAEEAFAGRSLGDFKRIGTFQTAPAGAAYGRVHIVKQGTNNAGHADSYGFVLFPMAAEASPYQTAFAGYSQSGQGTVITPGGIKTSSLEAISGVMGNLYSGSVRGGGFTGYGWPGNGAGGYYLGPEGLLLGNGNQGRYFQVEANGDVHAPKFSIINGRLTIDEVDVIDTLNIRGESVTVPRFAEATNNVTITPWEAGSGLGNAYLTLGNFDAKGAPVLCSVTVGSGGYGILITRWVNANLTQVLLHTTMGTALSTSFTPLAGAADYYVSFFAPGSPGGPTTVIGQRSVTFLTCKR